MEFRPIEGKDLDEFEKNEKHMEDLAQALGTIDILQKRLDAFSKRVSKLEQIPDTPSPTMLERQNHLILLIKGVASCKKELTIKDAKRAMQLSKQQFTNLLHSMIGVVESVPKNSRNGKGRERIVKLCK